MTPNARIPVSWGELIDKITILEIKAERLGTSAAVANALRELVLLTEATETIAKPPAELADLKAALRNVNRRLWDIEDAIRQKEAMQSFDAGFIDLARAVYRNNDERTRIKRAINDLLRSDIVEEKQYAPYRSGG